MSIPLDRLYHYIENIAKEVRGDDVIIYRFYPHGSKKVNDLKYLSTISWTNMQILPQIYCYDQEPLNYEYYQIKTDLSDEEYFLKYTKSKPSNIRYDKFNIYDKCILVHSELNSHEVVKYQSNGFIPVYYWSHAIIALDWFRFAQYQSQSKQIKKTFLIYNRAWSGSREYRLKFMDLLIKNNLIDKCQTTCNVIEPELQIHYSDHHYIDPLWAPVYQLEDYLEPTLAPSCSSADFELNDYNNTEFEVVLETFFDDPRNQLTEKILRPIACGQPFLILSSAGSLKYLHRYGFKTFSSVVDESYDNITDAKKRMQSLIDVMNNIANWSDDQRKNNMIKIKEITDYNKKHFFSKEFFNFVINELKQNLTQGLNELEKTNTSSRCISLRKNLSKNIKCKKILTQNTTSRSRQDIAQILKKARTYYNRYLKTLNK